MAKRARDIAGRRFGRWVWILTKDPDHLKALDGLRRGNRLARFEPDVANVAELSSENETDREILLRILSHVHSTRRRSAEIEKLDPAPKHGARGAPTKWNDKELIDDIEAANLGEDRLPPNRIIAQRLRKRMPQKYTKVELDTLIRRLQALRRSRK